MPTLRQRFTKYRETRKRKAREKKAAAEKQALEAARQAVAVEQQAIDAAAQTPLRKEFHRLLRETADRENKKRPTLVVPPWLAEGKTKQTKRQKKTQAKRKKTEKKQRIKHQKKTKKQHSPIRHYPPAQHVRLKKLLITALASSPGITPFKSNPAQTGESGVKDIEYDTFKYYGVPKSAYKVGKEYSKRFDRETKKFLPHKVSHLPVIEEPLYRE